jgi:hypothetical protein
MAGLKATPFPTSNMELDRTTSNSLEITKCWHISTRTDTPEELERRKQSDVVCRIAERQNFCSLMSSGVSAWDADDQVQCNNCLGTVSLLSARVLEFSQQLSFFEPTYAAICQCLWM